MTRQDFLIKWGVYVLALLPVCRLGLLLGELGVDCLAPGQDKEAARAL